MWMDKCVGIGLAVVWILACGVAVAQPAGYRSVADTDAFRKQFAAGSQKVTAITSDFVQVKELAALAEKVTATGKFWFKRSNKVRIDYEKPFVYRLIINGDRMLVKDAQKETRINAKSDKLFQQVNRIVVDCVQGTIPESKDFSTRVLEDDKTYRFEMTPVNKTLKEFFQSVVLTVDKKDYAAVSIYMFEPGGDSTAIIFSNKKLNTEVSDAVFAL